MLTKISKRSKGFTLVELLVTIAILAVLATVSVVGYTSFIEKSAVSTDNYLVAQLNDLTRLYKIEHTGNFEKSEVRKLLKDAGITSLELKSKDYNYRLYFNQNNQKFELTTDDYSNNDKYLLIDNKFLSQNDGDDIGGDNKNDEENNPGEVTPPAGGDQESGEEGESNSPETIEPRFFIGEFGDIPNDSDSKYIYSRKGIIYVGVFIENYGEAPVATNLKDIRVFEELDNGECKEWNIKNYIIDDVDITKQYKKYIFKLVGIHKLTVLLSDPMNTEIEHYVSFDIVVCNTFLEYASIMIDSVSDNNKLPIAKAVSENNYEFHIPLFEGIVIRNFLLPNEDNYSGEEYYDWQIKRIDGPTQKEVLEKIEIIITIAERKYEIDKSRLSIIHNNDNNAYDYYYAILDGFESSTLPENSYITYYFQGGNGVWVASDPVYIS